MIYITFFIFLQRNWSIDGQYNPSIRIQIIFGNLDTMETVGGENQSLFGTCYFERKLDMPQASIP